MNVSFRPRPMTRDQFFDWAERQDVRYEFDGARPVAMTGGTLSHSLVANAINRALHARLKGSVFRPAGPDAGLATIGDRVRYPDGMIARGKIDGEARVVPGAVVVFEVVSKTSGPIDKVEKVAEYQAVPSILRYVVVERTSAVAAVFERAAGDLPWTEGKVRAGEVLRIPEAGIEVPLDEVYEDVDLPGEAPG